MNIKIVESVGMDLIHGFFALLDSVVYGLISDCYEFIDALVEPRLESSIIDEISGRVYLILGIFMLFKVSWSFVTYIVNPDSMLDREKGVQKIITNIVVMFIMLVCCPWAFDQLYGVQNALLDDAVIENFVFGATTNGEQQFQMNPQCGDTYASIDMTENKGDFIALTLFKPFYQLNDDVDIDELDHDLVEGKKSYCIDADANEEISVSDYLIDDVYNNAPDWFWGNYAVSYLFGISTAVGVVALLIILNMLIDISLRTVKLMFLQLIAPIPIISYIDPKSGKNGIFAKWLKEVGSTWASLFIRLFAFNFAVFMIMAFTSEDLIKNNDGFFVNVFLILGALMFAKQLPKLIEDITGVKMGGGFSINPIKKIQDQALGGKFLTRAPAALLGAGASAAGSAFSHWNARNKFKQGVQKEKNALDEISSRRTANRDSYLRQKSELRELQARRAEAEKRFNNTDLNDTRGLQKALSAFERVDAQVNAKQASIAQAVTDGKALKEEYDAQKEKYDKKQEEAANSRLNNNVVRGYAGEIFHGAVQGAKNGYNSPGHLIHGTAEAIKDSSELRNYREKYSIIDQMGDRATDVLGIKNESGTTSIVKKELKAQTDTLNEVNRSIELLNRTISQMASEMGAEFQKAIQYAPNGRMEINASYSGPAAGRLSELEDIFTNYYGRIDEKVRIEKAIKDLQDTVDSVKPSSSGKPKK